MQQNVKYKAILEIEDEKPVVQLGFKFYDYFETVEYYLILDTENYSSIENVPFKIQDKNDHIIGKISLIDFDVKTFLNDFFNKIKDFDFKKLTIALHKDQVERDLTNFLDTYKGVIAESRYTLEGELKRMKVMAGIL